MKSYYIILVLAITILSTCVPAFSASLSTTDQILDTHNTQHLNPNLIRLLMLRTKFITILSGPQDDYVFTPQEMTLQDDAYHGLDGLHFTEWWYFDAKFDNGYSTQMSVRILSALGQGIVISRLDLYYQGELVQHTQKRYIIQQFIASKTKPDVVLKGNHVIMASVDPTSHAWIYNLTIDHGILSADLTFTGTTQGWKGQLMGGDWWGVALPRANVTGTLTFMNNTIPCSGIGYHDHNWEVTLAAGLNLGWIWGKIHSEQYTMTWSTIYKTRFMSNPILVINKNFGEHINIHPDNIEFDVTELNYQNGRFIPFSITISAHQDDIYLYVNMEVLKIHHVRVYSFLNYWRYHIHCTGFISIGDSRDNLDNIYIAELIRFR